MVFVHDPRDAVHQRIRVRAVIAYHIIPLERHPPPAAVHGAVRRPRGSLLLQPVPHGRKRGQLVAEVRQHPDATLVAQAFGSVLGKPGEWFVVTAIALFPDMLYFWYKIPYRVALFFGGTGTLITVGVLLETTKQMETYLLQRNYEGFLSKGALRGRSNLSSQFQMLMNSEDKGMRWLFGTVIALFVAGFVAWGLQVLFFK